MQQKQSENPQKQQILNILNNNNSINNNNINDPKKPHNGIDLQALENSIKQNQQDLLHELQNQGQITKQQMTQLQLLSSHENFYKNNNNQQEQTQQSFFAQYSQIQGSKDNFQAKQETFLEFLNYKITFGDIQHLDDFQELNDKLMSFFIAYLIEYDKQNDDELQKLCYFNLCIQDDSFKGGNWELQNLNLNKLQGQFDKKKYQYYIQLLKCNTNNWVTMITDSQNMLAYYRDFKFNEIYKINIEDPKLNFNYQQGGSQQIKLERSYISEQRENMQNQYLKNNFSYQPSTQQVLVSEPFDKNNSQSELKKEKKGFSFFGKSKKAEENLKKNNYCEILKNLYIQNMSEYEKTQLYINGNDNNNKKKKKEKEKIAGWDLRIQQKVPFAQDEEFEGDSGMQIIWLLFNFIRGVSLDNKFVLRTSFFLKDLFLNLLFSLKYNPKDRTNAIKLDNLKQFLVLQQENSIYQLNLNLKKESKMQEIKDKFTQTYIDQQNDTDMTPKNLKMNQTQMNLTQLQQSVLSQKNDTASNINQNTGIISQGQKNQETIMEYQYNNKMLNNAYQICQECEKKLKDLQILQRENERLKYILQYKELSIQKQNNMLGNYAKQNNELKEKNTELNALAQRLKSQQIYVSQLMAEQKLTVKNDKNQGSRYIRSKTSQNIKYLPPNPKKQINQNSTLGQKSNFKLKPLLQSGSQNQSIIVPNKVVGVEKYLQENSIKQNSQKNLSYMDSLQSPQKFYSQQKKQVELKKIQNDKELGNNSHLIFQKNDQFLDENEKNKINQLSSKRPSTTEKNLISPTKFSNSSKFQPTFFNAEDFEKQKNEQKSQQNQQTPSLNMTNQSFKRSQSQLKSKTNIKKAMNSTNTPLGTKTRRELLEIYDQTEELETFSQQFQQSLKILEKWKMSNLKIYQDDVFAIENLLQDKLNMDSPQNKEFFAGQLVFYFKEFRHAIDLLQVQHQIQSYTFNSFNFQDIYHKIVNSLKQLFQCEKLLLFIYNGQSNEFIAQQDQQKQEINQQGNTQSTFNQFGDNKAENGEKIIKLKPEKGILQEAFIEKVLKKIDNISSATQFCPEIDGAIQKKVKNLIWSPCLDEQGDIKAMIQIVNFQTQEQNRNINRDDKLSLQVMGKCIGNLLKGAEKFKIAIMGQNRLNQVIKTSSLLQKSNRISDIIIYSQNCIQEVIKNSKCVLYILNSDKSKILKFSKIQYQQEQRETSTLNFEKYQPSQSFQKKFISLQTVEKYFKNNNSNFNKKWQQSQIISNYYAEEDFEVTEIDKFVGICGQCLKNEQQIILENHQNNQYFNTLVDIDTSLGSATQLLSYDDEIFGVFQIAIVKTSLEDNQNFNSIYQNEIINSIKNIFSELIYNTLLRINNLEGLIESKTKLDQNA